MLNRDLGLEQAATTKSMADLVVAADAAILDDHASLDIQTVIEVGIKLGQASVASKLGGSDVQLVTIVKTLVYHFYFVGSVAQVWKRIDKLADQP